MLISIFQPVILSAEYLVQFTSIIETSQYAHQTLHHGPGLKVSPW